MGKVQCLCRSTKCAPKSQSNPVLRNAQNPDCYHREQRLNLETLRIGTGRFVKSDGFVLLLILLSLLGILGVVFVTGLVSGGEKLSRGATTSVALAKAKAALLAYALSGDDAGRPGEFPCPTVVAPTVATYGTSAGSCATVRVGRLPWRTLGIQEPFDSAGEPLWYAVSNKFRPAVAKINSDILGDLTIYDRGGSAVLANQVVAIIFSAGAPVSNQNRTSTVSFCSTTSTSITGNTCAANYLDTSSGRDNATNAGPYIADRSSSTFNDQLVYITTADFMPKIEERIAAFLTRTLNDYYATNGYYPYAANYSEQAFPNELNCANGIYAGRFPFNITSPPHTGTTCTALAEWPSSGSPSVFPAWFTLNQWNVAVHYVVGKAFAKGGTKVCAVLGDCLTVDGDNAVQAMFILPGIPTSSQTRPSSIPSNYLEAVANLDDWPAPTNYSYVTTTSTLPSRDRVVAIKNP